MIYMSIDDFKHKGGLTGIAKDKSDDIFIVAASYEPRSTAIADCLASDYKAKLGILYINDEFMELDESGLFVENIEKLQSILGDRCDSFREVKGSWLNAVKQWESIRETMLSFPAISDTELNITLDMSTFNRESLIVFLEVIRSNYDNANIRAAYTSPADMGDWLSRGYRGIRNVLGFPGVQNPNNPNLLVVLSGFEPERTTKIIDEHEPSKVLLGIGNPPTDEKFLARNKSEQSIVLSRQETECFEFPARDVDACYKSLEETISGYLKTHNIILAPMSTKLSTLASILLAEKYPDIQITYCLPGEYNTKGYSTGIKGVYLYNLPKRPA